MGIVILDFRFKILDFWWHPDYFGRDFLITPWVGRSKSKILNLKSKIRGIWFPGPPKR